MVSRELDYNININDNNLENYLELYNPSYKQARTIYNQLNKNSINPLTDHGLSGDKFSFIIILLEKILRNSNLLLEQNDSINERIALIEQKISDIKRQGLDPIIQAGNKITSELITFENGFKTWNNKFENFSNIFENWNLGFNRFDENLERLNTSLANFSEYWNNRINLIQTNLSKIELHLAQWNDEIIRVNNCIQNIDKRLFIFEQKQNISVTTSSTNRQIFQKLPDKNHKFTF